MGHLIEEYAKNLGVKIGKPIFEPHFIPIVDEKYITIHVDNKINSKYYEFFPEVIDLIKPHLSANGYKIYQIGGDSDPLLNGVHKSYLGLSRKQSAYIIKNSSLHLGIDSFPVHLASAYDIPIVTLYSHIYPQNAYPYWSSKDKVKILEADRKGLKPCFGYDEKPKSIHTIKPEEVAKSVFDLLKIPYTKSINTLFIGEQYAKPLIEIVPNFFGHSDELKDRVLTIRADYEFNQEIFSHWCSTYKVEIVSEKPIDVNLLKTYKNNILNVVFYINDTDTFTENYLNSAKNTGVQIQYRSKNKNDIQKIRMSYFDFPIELETEVDQNKINELKNIPNLKFLTKKDIFSKGKRYASKAHLDSDKVFLDKVEDVIYNDQFWKDIEHYFIYEE